MRLIDADALKKVLGFADPCANCKHVYGVFLCDDAIWQEVCDAIYEAPTIDAVPVVRCKDCKRFAPDKDGGDWGMCTDEGSMMLTQKDFGCLDGERKEDEED